MIQNKKNKTQEDIKDIKEGLLPIGDIGEFQDEDFLDFLVEWSDSIVVKDGSSTERERENKRKVRLSLYVSLSLSLSLSRSLSL
jgi:hypothetical protein